MEPPAKGMRRALVVEDYAPVRSACRQTLTAAGWRVDEASDGAEALDLLGDLADEDRYDLILSDVNMPRVGGVELYTRLALDYPASVGTLALMSAGPADEELAWFLKHTRIAYLAKPFTAAALVDMAERVSRRVDRGTPR